MPDATFVNEAKTIKEFVHRRLEIEKLPFTPAQTFNSFYRMYQRKFIGETCDNIWQRMTNYYRVNGKLP